MDMGVTHNILKNKMRTGLALFTIAVCLLAAAEYYRGLQSPPAPSHQALETTPPKPSADSIIDGYINILVDSLKIPQRKDYTYTLQSGDSPHRIAADIQKKYNLYESITEIAQDISIANNIEDPRRLKVGDALKIPLSQFVKGPEPTPLDYRMMALYEPYKVLDNLSHFTPEPLFAPEEYASRPGIVFYTVRQGDSLYNIARAIKENEGLQMPLVWFVQEIAEQNDVYDPKEVHPDTVLEIPLTGRRTMSAMLTYDGFKRRGAVLKLFYAKSEINAFVQAALKKYDNIPQKVFSRMLRVESGSNHLAISPVAAAGLLQLMPLTAKKLGLRVWNPKGYRFPENIASPGAKALYQRYARELQEMAQTDPLKLMRLDDRFNPQKNVLASARLFSRLVSEHGCANAVALYNGGSRALTKYRARETSAYMRLVLR